MSGYGSVLVARRLGRLLRTERMGSHWTIRRRRKEKHITFTISLHENNPSRNKSCRKSWSFREINCFSINKINIRNRVSQVLVLTLHTFSYEEMFLKVIQVELDRFRFAGGSWGVLCTHGWFTASWLGILWCGQKRLHSGVVWSSPL